MYGVEVRISCGKCCMIILRDGHVFLSINVKFVKYTLNHLDVFVHQQAKEAGSTRFCMGAAWRDTVGRKTNFNQILEYVKEIR